jgi:hypothetical protein
MGWATLESRTPAPANSVDVRAAAGGAGDSARVAVLLVADIAHSSRLWGWSRFVLGPRALRGVPGLRLAKVLGSGYQGGFGLRPSGSLQGLFCIFDDEASAVAFRDGSPWVAAYQRHARELFSVLLRPWSSRGSWDGATFAPAEPPPAEGPVAALTRASIRPHKAWSFWRVQPASERALERAAGCRMAVGLGEAPLLRQATFSVWDDVAAMEAYARSGAHGEAARRAYAEGYFSEWMFVRFQPVAPRGSFRGRRLDG